MTNRAGKRAWLGGAVAVAILAGLALVDQPDTAPARPPGPGQPMGAVSPPDAPGQRSDAARVGAVTELLDRRADALLDRDEQAFLATIDPHADAEFVADQRELFRNLAGVPLSTWRYELYPNDTLPVGDLPASVTGAGSEREASELWAPAVDLSYALRGVDDPPTSKPMGYLFARHGDSWYLRSDTALDELGRDSWRGPWNFGPLRVASTRYGLVLSHPGSEAMVERLVDELDASVRAVREVWGSSGPRRVALLLPDTPGEMRALIGPDFPIESVVAVAVADRVDTERRMATGQRVVLNPLSSRALSTTSLRVVLRHEITHVMARAETVDGAPMWLLEGFADYVGYRDSGLTLITGAPDLTEQVRQHGPPAALPSDEDFRSRGSQLNLTYQKAWSVAMFLAERYGESRLVEVYRERAGAGPISAGQSDRLLSRLIGLDRAGLVAEWQRYLKRVVG